MSFVSKLAMRNLAGDKFGTLCAIIGVALGTATVETVLVLDHNTVRGAEKPPVVHKIKSIAGAKPPPARAAPKIKRMKFAEGTVELTGYRPDGSPSLKPRAAGSSPKRKDYEVMRSAIRLGSLSAFLVGALIVFFTFGVVVERRKREIALLRSLGALPNQVAQVILLEAVIVGGLGGFIGLVMSIPMTLVATKLGFTTTGRAVIYDIDFPWLAMLGMATIGAGTAIVGIIRPAVSILKLDVARTLMPRFVGLNAQGMRKTPVVRLIVGAAVFGAYVLLRPVLQAQLPTLLFFLGEAALVCVVFFGGLLTIPEVVRWLGTMVSKIVPGGPKAARLLVLRRVQNLSHELSWSVGGLMLVCGLVLSLHLVTQSLKVEIHDWSQRAIRPYTFIYNTVNQVIPRRYMPDLPKNVIETKFTARTDWPNPVYAVEKESLLKLLEAGRDPVALEEGKRLGKGKVIISRNLSRRLDLGEGDRLEISGVAGKRRFEVVAVTDRVGYVPKVGPYKQTKVYALLDYSDYDIIKPYAADLGAALVFAEPGVPQPKWVDSLDPIETWDNAYVDTGLEFEADRVREANRDFAIFDLILLLTTLLAAIGVANNMVLAAHSRRRELAIYRVLGMTRRQLAEMFLVEGMFIGILGGTLATLMGAPLGWAAVNALEYVAAFDVRFDFPAQYVAITVFGATLVAVTSVIYPATRAAKSGSAESVHYE